MAIKAENLRIDRRLLKGFEKLLFLLIYDFIFGFKWFNFLEFLIRIEKFLAFNLIGLLIRIALLIWIFFATWLFFSIFWFVSFLIIPGSWGLINEIFLDVIIQSYRIHLIDEVIWTIIWIIHMYKLIRLFLGMCKSATGSVFTINAKFASFFFFYWVHFCFL